VEVRVDDPDGARGGDCGDGRTGNRNDPYKSALITIHVVSGSACGTNTQANINYVIENHPGDCAGVFGSTWFDNPELSGGNVPFNSCLNSGSCKWNFRMDATTVVFRQCVDLQGCTNINSGQDAINSGADLCDIATNMRPGTTNLGYTDGAGNPCIPPVMGPAAGPPPPCFMSSDAVQAHEDHHIQQLFNRIGPALRQLEQYIEGLELGCDKADDNQAAHNAAQAQIETQWDQLFNGVVTGVNNDRCQMERDAFTYGTNPILDNIVRDICNNRMTAVQKAHCPACNGY